MRTLSDEIAAGEHDAEMLRQWSMGRNTCEIAIVLFRSKQFEPAVVSRLRLIRDAAREKRLAS